MKNQLIKGMLLSGILSILFACNTKTEEVIVIDKEQVKKEIQDRENEYAALYNAGEIKNIGYYAEDAITFFQNRPPLVGRDSIVAFLKADIISNTNTISFTTKDVFASNDGVQVVEVGSYKVVDSAGVVLNTGNYMSLFEKRDGKYVCLRDMSASDMPRE